MVTSNDQKTSFEEHLYSKYPNLFKSDVNEPITYSGIQCDEGWFNLIDKLCENINNVIKTLPQKEQDDFYICQIKEKFGKLRFYTTSLVKFYETREAAEICELIEVAEKRSSETCEICGKKGKIKSFNWLLKCVCEDHEKIYQKQ